MAILALAFLATAGCSHHPASFADPCSGLDPVLARTSFVTLLEPRPGQRLRSSFLVMGCSNTFEANVVWELRGRDGRVLSRGHTSGGTLGAPREFSFDVAYALDTDELGTLEVFEPDASDGEGFPPVRVLFPVVLSASR